MATVLITHNAVYTLVLYMSYVNICHQLCYDFNANSSKCLSFKVVDFNTKHGELLTIL